MEPTTGKLGHCKMQQVVAHCKTLLNSKLMITNYLTLNVFGSNINDIAQVEDVTEESLLTAPPFVIVTSISRTSVT